jgi:hypothetical protein
VEIDRLVKGWMLVENLPLNSSLPSALDWSEKVLLGSAGTAIAVLAVAGIGFAMLRGGIPVRRGVVTITGCFILFSSRAIAAALVGAVVLPPVEGKAIPVAAPPAYMAPIAPTLPYDPYAGASVPERPQDSARILLPQ